MDSIWPWVSGGGLVLAILLAGWLWRTRPWRGPRPRYPVVLAHGLLGFGDDGVAARLGQEYFRGIVPRLRALGVQVYTPAVPPTGSIAARAAALKRAIDAIDAPKVNIIAHSMGGLDARYAIAKLGLGPKVKSLTTIGTPHRGTPVADFGRPLKALFETTGLGALGELTTQTLAAFEDDRACLEGITCGSVVAIAPREPSLLHPMLRITHRYLSKRAGPNDGLVPQSSQRWGTVLAEVEADHWAQIGWASGFDAPTFYERLMVTLRRKGC